MSGARDGDEFRAGDAARKQPGGLLDVRKILAAENENPPFRPFPPFLPYPPYLTVGYLIPSCSR
jgi:hypothetical protein